MLAKFLITLSVMMIMSSAGHARRIYPVKDCPMFSLSYSEKNGRYLIQHPSQKNTNIAIRSISDLSSIADLIEQEAQKFCPGLTPKDKTEACHVLENLDHEFIDLVQRAARTVAGQEDIPCDELTKYIELQDKISALDPKNPFEIGSASNVGNAFLKLFAGSAEDRLIDHFEACGGGPSSDKFIQNLILIEAHNSCIMPKPPGLLTWEQMRSLAQDIAKKHKNKSIFSIRDEKPEIEKETLIQITKAASINQLKELMPSINAEETLTKLDAWKNLTKSRNVSSLKDYIKLVYQPDAAIEIAEKSMEDLVFQNMMPKLPVSWSEGQKEKFVQTKLMPEALIGFNECLTRPKKNINYGHKADPEINLNYRNYQKAGFCKIHRMTCIEAEKPDCVENKASINILSMDPTVKDAEVAKSCVMNGMAQVIKPVFALTLKTQVDSFRKDVNLPPDMAEHFTEGAWKSFRSCVNNHKITRSVSNGKGYQPIFNDKTTNPLPFRKMDPDQYKNLLSDCSAQVEKQLTRDFVEVVFISNENVIAGHTTGPKVEFHGSLYHASAVDYTRKTVTRVMDECNKRQGEKPVPTVCTPLLELEVAQSVIRDKLKTMLAEKGLSDSLDARALLGSFSNCAKVSSQKAMNAVGSSLKTSEDAKTYLEKDNAFYACVEAAVVKTAELVGNKVFHDAIDERKNSLLSYRDISKLDLDIMDTVGKCFKYNIKNNEVKNWTDFKNFNAKNGLQDVQKHCTEKVNEYAIPKVMIMEARAQLLKARFDGMMEKDSDPQNILKESLEELGKKFDVRVSSLLVGPERQEALLRGAYKIFTGQNRALAPSAAQALFINTYKDVILGKSIKRVYGDVMASIESKARDQYSVEIPELANLIAPSCLQAIYQNFVDHRPKDYKPSPMELDKLTSQLADGLNYLKRSGDKELQDQLSKLKALCSNTRAYNSMEELKASGLFDFVVKSQIQKKTIAALAKIADDAYAAELEKFKLDPNFSQIKPFIEKKRDDMLKLIQEHLFDNKSFEKLLFPSEIIPYALQNSNEISVEGSRAQKKINELVMAQMFKDKSRDSFASAFSQAQIVNSVGISGVGEARESIEKILKDYSAISDTVRDSARSALAANWTVLNVQRRFGWDSLPDFARIRLIDSVYTHAISPVISQMPQDQIDSHRAQLTKQVSSHLDGWHTNGKTFKQNFTEAITKGATEDIAKNRKGQAATEAIYRWLTEK